MPGKKQFIFLFFSLCIHTEFSGQSNHPLTEYSTENGLSLNSVNDLQFDKQGFLWVATADGLQRFDGYRFQTFKYNEQEKLSLPENSVSNIYEDQDNNLWITHRTGICFKPKRGNEFFELTNNMTSDPFRYSLIPAYETDSTLWILNYPSGIYSINKNSLASDKLYNFTGFTDQDVIYPLTRVYTKGDNLWFKKGLDKGGDIYMVSEHGLKQYKNEKKLKILFLIPENKDSLVIITDKLIYKSTVNDPFSPARNLKSKFDWTSFENKIIFQPKKMANDQYLLVGNQNLMIYDSRKEELTPFSYSNYFSKDISRYLHTSTVDQHQNTWLGFNGIGGIKVISLQKFNLFQRPEKNALTYTLASGQDGNVYAGIYFGDIEVYSEDGVFLHKLKLPDAHKKFGSPRAMAMIDSVTLIVRSTLKELYAINTHSGSLQLLTDLFPHRQDSLFMDFESGILKKDRNEVWLSYSNSVFSIKKNQPGRQTGKKEYTSTTICNLPVKEHITCLFYSDAGQLWIGTITGAWVYEHNSFQKILLPHSYVKQINQHPGGGIWIATTNGIYILKNKKIDRHLNMKDGLPNSFVYSVQFDDEGNSWVSTNRGIAKITPANLSGDLSYQITNYSAKEGLQGEEFNTKGYCKGSDGTLYFAGVNGINFFNPKNLVSKSAPSETMLTEIEVNNQPWMPNLQPEFINTISLTYKQNNIRLSFACMDLTVPEKNKFKFWLKGFQDDWTLPQTNHTVQYILPPGDYELYVLSSNYEGVWSKEPLILKINIKPPWYQTNWARIIFILLALAIIGAVFYFISRNKYQKNLRKLQMEQEMQKEKQRLSRDLHDNLGSQITWLSNNITQLENAQQHEQPLEQKLSRLKEGSGELMQTLRETIWILNKDKISGIDFFDKLVSHAAKYIEAYPSMQLQTEEKISSDIQLGSGQALQLFRICQEAVTNACKHSNASLLIISANSNEDRFNIRISDNGKGFDLNNENEGHYGLQNMKQRATESNLQLSIESSPDKETTITVTLQV